MKRILYLDSQNDFFGRQLWRGFMQTASKRKWWGHLYQLISSNDLDSLTEILPSIDGVACRGQNPETLQLLESHKVPYIQVRSKNSLQAADTPHVNDKLIGKIATSEMAKLNVAHRGYLGYKNVSWSNARGFHYLKHDDFKDQKEISYLQLSEHDTLSISSLNKVITWLEKMPKPAGVFCANDNLGAVVLAACQMKTLKIPEQVAVIGVDNNIDRCNSTSPALSSINLNSESLGQNLAYQFAHQLGIINDAELSEAPFIPAPSLVVRESSHKITPHVHHYLRGKEWISRHALVGPSVEEVAKACSISRRALERAFKQNIEQSPAQVIREERMAQITEILQKEKVSLLHIADQAKFPDIPSFSNFVKRQTGKTPGEIRAEHNK